MNRLIITLLTLMWINSSQATFMTGISLLENCNGGTKAKALCVGYIEGVLDYDVTRQMWHGSDRKEEGWRPREFSICAAYGITGDQTVKIVTKFLNEHPEELHSDASSLVALALMDAFPCKND